MVSNRTLLASTISAFVAVAVLVGYAFYFDSKRKKNKDLRQRIKEEKNREAIKQKKKSSKIENSALKSKKNKSSSLSPTTTSIIEMIPEMALQLEDIYAMPPSERERVFYSLLVKGEELLSFKTEESNISNSYTEAAVQLFFKAIKMMPNPTELLISLQQVLPKSVFNTLTTLITEDGLKRIISYFTSIVPKETPITISPKKLILANGEVEQTWAIFATKNIEAGTIIYEEKPDASSLFIENITNSKYCDYCLKAIGTTIINCENCSTTIFCSEDCLSSAKIFYHSALCCNDSLSKLIEISKSEHSEYSLLVARYLSVLCSEEKKIREDQSKKHNSRVNESTSSHFEYMKPLLLPVLPSDDKIATVLQSLFSNISPDIVERKFVYLIF